MTHANERVFRDWAAPCRSWQDFSRPGPDPIALAEPSLRKRIPAVTAKDQETNFHKHARLVRDKLGCQDALFLDGDISQMAVNPKGAAEGNRFGAVLVVAEEE